MKSTQREFLRNRDLAHAGSGIECLPGTEMQRAMENPWHRSALPLAPFPQRERGAVALQKIYGSAVTCGTVPPQQVPFLQRVVKPQRPTRIIDGSGGSYRVGPGWMSPSRRLSPKARQINNTGACRGSYPEDNDSSGTEIGEASLWRQQELKDENVESDRRVITESWESWQDEERKPVSPKDASDVSGEDVGLVGMPGSSSYTNRNIESLPPKRQVRGNAQCIEHHLNSHGGIPAIVLPQSSARQVGFQGRDFWPESKGNASHPRVKQAHYHAAKHGSAVHHSVMKHTRDFEGTVNRAFLTSGYGRQEQQLGPLAPQNTSRHHEEYAWPGKKILHNLRLTGGAGGRACLPDFSAEHLKGFRGGVSHFEHMVSGGGIGHDHSTTRTSDSE